MSQPGVDIVVPFAGSEAALAILLTRLERLVLADGDTLTVVDNRSETMQPGVLPSQVEILLAPERQSSYFARNRGAAAGSNEWIVFIDADTEPIPDLLDRYFGQPPDANTAIVGGAVVDRGPEPGGKREAARLFAGHGRILDQLDSLERRGGWGFVKTANCAVRRSAFELVGGFCDDVRSGGDADLCIRLAAAGWTIGYCEQAKVIHHGRTTVRALARQYARWGSGAAWLNRRYPGFHPPKGFSVAPMTLRRLAGAARALLRRDRDGAVIRLVEILAIWAFELGRMHPNRVR